MSNENMVHLGVVLFGGWLINNKEELFPNGELDIAKCVTECLKDLEEIEHRRDNPVPE